MSLGLNIKHLKVALNTGICHEVSIIPSSKQFRSLVDNEETWNCDVTDTSNDDRYKIIYTVDRPSQKVKTIINISKVND